ncbi:MAG: carboxypeptidase-like regulatory domain-containing protein, partial [Acidobacteriaceae bacterium]
MRKFCGAMLLFCSSIFVYGQSPDSAALRGQVTGPNGAAVAGTQVIIEDAQHQVLREVTTGSDGSFAAEGLRAEPVVVRAEGSGLAATSGQITLAAGAMATVRLQLHVPTVHAEVVVTGAANEVRTDEPQLGDRLTAQQMQATPLLNRRITYLPLLNAANRQAINQGDVFMNQDLMTANGTGRRQTWFEVDGA